MTLRGVERILADVNGEMNAPWVAKQVDAVWKSEWAKDQW